jgi:hypothetical protein
MNSIECKRRDSNSCDFTWKVDTLILFYFLQLNRRSEIEGPFHSNSQFFFFYLQKLIPALPLFTFTTMTAMETATVPAITAEDDISEDFPHIKADQCLFLTLPSGNVKQITLKPDT